MDIAQKEVVQVFLSPHSCRLSLIKETTNSYKITMKPPLFGWHWKKS